MGTETPRPLTGRRLAWEYEPGRTPDPDIAIIELSKEDVNDLKGHYQFSTASVTSTIKAKTPGVHYLIAGYPAARNPIGLKPTLLPSSATHLITGDIRPVSNLKLRDKVDDHHFALTVPRDQIRNKWAGAFRMPNPRGMSGGGVWRLDIDIPRQLATTPLLVGIAIEYYKSRELFLATRVQSAIPLVYELIDMTKESENECNDV